MLGADGREHAGDFGGELRSQQPRSFRRRSGRGRPGGTRPSGSPGMDAMPLRGLACDRKAACPTARLSWRPCGRRAPPGGEVPRHARLHTLSRPSHDHALPSRPPLASLPPGRCREVRVRQPLHRRVRGGRVRALRRARRAPPGEATPGCPVPPVGPPPHGRAGEKEFTSTSASPAYACPSTEVAEGARAGPLARLGTRVADGARAAHGARREAGRIVPRPSREGLSRVRPPAPHAPGIGSGGTALRARPATCRRPRRSRWSCPR